MRIRNLLIVFTILLVSNAFSQTKQEPSKYDDDVVKITTKVVQLDALVTDKDGRPVNGLTREDFELLEDGKPQTITGFTFVTADPAAYMQNLSGKANKTSTPAPPIPAKMAANGRIITFVVDDGNCSASQLGMVNARESIEKFINEQMLPTDRVAIYQTRSGSSVLQQYSSDKPLLLRAVRRVRWYPPTEACTFSDGSVYEAGTSNTFSKITSAGIQTKQIESPEERKIRQAGEDFTSNNQVVGTIGVLQYVVRGLGAASGRKVVFFLSDGLPFRTRDGHIASAVDALRNVTDLANRSAVVFNTVSVRGVENTSMIEARDEVSTSGETDVNSSDRLISDRTRDSRNNNEGLSVLADETGGTFYYGSNFFDGLFRKALVKESGYYLLAYEPNESTFKGKNFNHIEIRVKRPDLKVSSRSGFLGTPDVSQMTPKNKSANSELYRAMAAPLPNAGLNLQLSSYFVNTRETGNVVRSLIHLPGDQLAFVDDGNLKKAVIDVVAVALNEKNEVVDEFTRTHTFRIDPGAMPIIQANGLMYSTDVPIKKPGTYNFRVGIRDVSNNVLGTASQVIRVPDLKKGDLFLSGLTVTQLDRNGKFSVPGAARPEEAISLIGSQATPSVRVFSRGSVLVYSYNIYNAKLDPTTGIPKLTVQMNLYRDGKIIFEGKPTAAELEKQEDLSRITDYGYLKLNSDVELSDYAVQIIVTDTLRNGEGSVSNQWIDFEVR